MLYFGQLPECCFLLMMCLQKSRIKSKQQKHYGPDCSGNTHHHFSFLRDKAMPFLYLQNNKSIFLMLYCSVFALFLVWT